MPGTDQVDMVSSPFRRACVIGSEAVHFRCKVRIFEKGAEIREADLDGRRIPEDFFRHGNRFGFRHRFFFCRPEPDSHVFFHELVDCIQSAAGTFAAQDQHIFRGRNDDLIIVQ